MFKWLKKIFGSGPQTRKVFFINIKCSKCGNSSRIAVDPKTDLIRGYSKNEPPYRLHKETVDSNCYNNIVIDIKYDNQYQPLEKNISGAEFLEEK